MGGERLWVEAGFEGVSGEGVGRCHGEGSGDGGEEKGFGEKEERRDGGRLEKKHPLVIRNLCSLASVVPSGEWCVSFFFLVKKIAELIDGTNHT